LIDDLEIEPEEIVQLAVLLEEKFGLGILDQELESMETVGDIYAMLEYD
jgi:acyl carrier protein|tara:strand:+ start:293 stop:439 length:147 start_codon:yes stop_codon:yes gene_type:complete